MESFVKESVVAIGSSGHTEDWFGLIIDCITKKPVMHWRTHLSSIPASKRPDSKEVYETSSRLR